MQGRNRRTAECGIVIPPLEGRAVTGRNAERKVRVLDRVGGRRDCACRARRLVIHHIGDRIDNCRAPLHVEVLVLEILHAEAGHRGCIRRIRVPALEGITGSTRRSERKVGT